MIEKKSFHDSESKFTGKYSSSVKDTLWLAYRPALPMIIFCLLCGLVGRMALLANANVIGMWVDSLCKLESCKPVPVLFQNFDSINYILLLAGLSLLGFCLILLFRVIFSRLSAQAVSQIYDETTLRTSRQPMSFFDSTPAGRIITRFSSDYGNVFRLFGGPLAELFAIIFDIVGMIILVTMASPLYLPVVLVVGVLDYGIFRLNIQRLRQSRRNLSVSRSPSIAHFAETAQGASTIRSFVKQKSFSQRFALLDRDYLNDKLGATKSVLFFSFQINSMTALFLLTTGILAWWFLQAGMLSIGSVGVAFGFIALSGGTVQMFFEWISQFEEAMVGVERLDNYIRRPLEKGALLPISAQFNTGHAQETLPTNGVPGDVVRLNQKSAAVQFDQVWFRYRENLPYVLKNLSFEIHAGERFGIIGRTGSGKSSLIQALFLLYPVEQGKITIDNQRAIFDLDLRLFRRSIAFIAQDPTLFKGSLLDNLDVSREFPPDQIFLALRQVGLSDWANALKLEMKIEERGRNLSQGERQLICMARCLLQDSPVVVMDEATSSVDPQSEEILVKATEEFFEGKTQIIIAHRLSTLQNCHRILWLQNGEIKMIGTPQEVLPIFQRSNLSL